MANSNRFYKTSEAAEILGLTKRGVQKKCVQDNLPTMGNRYIILEQDLKSWGATDSMIKKWLEVERVRIEKEASSRLKTLKKEEQSEKSELTLEKAIELVKIAAAKKDLHYRVFTEDEYNDVIEGLAHLEAAQEQVRYLRERVDKQDEILQRLSKSIEQRNFIEAKEKGFDQPS